MKEQISYRITPKRVYKLTEGTSAFPGAVQPRKDIKYFRRQENIKDFGEKQKIKKRIVGERMKFFKRQS